MGLGYFYASIIAVVILYVNTVSIIKRVQKEQDTAINTLIGCICSIVALVSIYAYCGR